MQHLRRANERACRRRHQHAVDRPPTSAEAGPNALAGVIVTTTLSQGTNFANTGQNTWAAKSPLEYVDGARPTWTCRTAACNEWSSASCMCKLNATVAMPSTNPMNGMLTIANSNAAAARWSLASRRRERSVLGMDASLPRCSEPQLAANALIRGVDGPDDRKDRLGTPTPSRPTRHPRAGCSR